MNVEKFNRKYGQLGGWDQVLQLREDGITWHQIGHHFNLSPQYLWRLHQRFKQMDSLSGGKR